MTEELLPGLYKINVPMPDSPLKVLNAYLVRGTTRHLLIDNGYRRPECHDVLFGALAELGITTDALDFFLTHRHADHCGLTADLATSPDAKIYCSKDDARHINLIVSQGETHWPAWVRTMLPHGFRPEDVDALVDAHPAKRYAPARPLDFTIIQEGNALSYGRFRFTVISTPGHSPDHVCLYEPNEQLFFSGDHILGTITPNITRWQGFPDALGQYLHSLDKVKALPIRLTLPGHRALVPDTQKRIEALQTHHTKRLEEALAILKKGAADAYTVASQMRWSIRANTWNDFPVPQRWFACGEALAHLEHLAATGRAMMREENGRCLYAVLK